MRLYKRSEFLKLPSGIIYSSGPPHAYQGMHIKLDSYPENNDNAITVMSGE